MEEILIDLALPSGTLWAKCNLGAEKESDFGLFYQWADTQGYDGDAGHDFDWSTYKWGASDHLTKYSSSDEKLVLDNEDDPVWVATDGKMKSPTQEQLEELRDFTNHEWTEIDGIKGMKFTNKSDDTKYIFIPAAGFCYGSNHYDVGSWGYVWSSSRNSSLPYYAWGMGFNSGDVSMFNDSRCYGCSVRGVMVPKKKEGPYDNIDDTDDGTPVDLGLPSGTLWQKSNLGGSKPSDFGKFYSWGDVQGYDGDAGHDFSWNAYKYGTSPNNMTKYNSSDGKLVLDNEDDPVYAATSGRYKTPTKDQLQELIDNTEHRWVSLANGVNGMKFWKKGTDEPINGNSYIFIPEAGNCSIGSHVDVGAWGSVWSASRDESYADYAWGIGFGAGHVIMGHGFRWLGFSVRGVLNTESK